LIYTAKQGVFADLAVSARAGTCFRESAWATRGGRRAAFADARIARSAGEALRRAITGVLAFSTLRAGIIIGRISIHASQAPFAASVSRFSFGIFSKSARSA